MTLEERGMLHIVAKNDLPHSQSRLGLARRHIETAIAHINDVAQTHVPLAASGSSAAVDELRLIVRALADIREALCTSEWSAPTSQLEPAAARAEGSTGR